MESNWKWSVFDPSQPVQVESSLSSSKAQPGMITLSPRDVANIIQWAYPDQLYRGREFPSSDDCPMPIPLIASLSRVLPKDTQDIYDGFEVRYCEEHDEYFLMGIKNKESYQVAQWRYGSELRSLRMIIDDASPSMKEWCARYGRIGNLSIFLACAAAALLLGHIKLHELSLLYISYVFWSLAGAAVIWYVLRYPHYLRASVVVLIEDKEEDQGYVAICQ